jgi:hypothetical protein
MEAKLVISLYSYLYLKLTKMLCLSFYFLCFLLKKIREEVRTSSAWKQEELGEEGQGRETVERDGPNNVCT